MINDDRETILNYKSKFGDDMSQMESFINENNIVINNVIFMESCHNYFSFAKWIVNNKSNIINNESLLCDIYCSLCSEGMIDRMKWLLSLKSYDIYDFNIRKTLKYAASFGQLEIIKELVKDKTQHNDHIFHFAYINGHINIVKWIESTINKIGRASCRERV